MARQLRLRPVLLGLILAAGCSAAPQSRLSTYPGYEAAQEQRPKLMRGVRLASLRGVWISPTELSYREGSDWMVFNAATGETREGEAPAADSSPHPNSRRRRPARGRQYTETFTKDGKVKADYRDGNVWLIEGDEEQQITTEGDAERRIKFGSGSWVYGEELGQNEAMGFSDDGRYLWLYRFDDRPVKDYHLAVDQNRPQSRLYIEAYPKPGQDNPIVDLYVYDRTDGDMTKVKVRPGEFDEGVGHYVYEIRFAPESSTLLFHRTNRKQQINEYCSANPETGAVTVLDREEHTDGWVENRWPKTFVGERILWLSERSGFANFYWLNWKTGDRTQITRNDFDVRGLPLLDQENEVIYYTANEAQNGRHQIRRIGFDGSDDRRLSDPDFHHSVNIAPGGGYWLDTYQSATAPPRVVVRDSDGKEVKVMAESDISGFEGSGYRPNEPFSYKSADGTYDLNGRIHYPVNFDPSKEYPVLASVYGGPGGPMGSSWTDTYRLPARETDYGFIVVNLENRGQGGRGRAFKDALYQNMGITEIDDMAAGVKALADRSYCDLDRVGIFGTSYGGYAALMALARHPDVFHAGSSSSCVSDWRNYDTIYTERYMGVLPESKDAYDKTSAVRRAADVEGELLMYYGTSDDNTHPTNALQMIAALQRAGKTHEVQVGVDRGHSGVDWRRMMEFFIEHLGTTK